MEVHKYVVMEDRIISVKSAVVKEYVIMEDRSLTVEIVTQSEQTNECLIFL